MKSRFLVSLCAVGLILSLSSVTNAAALSASDLLVYYDFNDDGDPLETPDLSGNGPAATLEGGAAYSADADGFSGVAGDLSLDLGGVNNGASARIPAGDHFNPAFDNNAMSVSFWQNSTSNATNTSAFWIVSPAASGTVRGFQAHTPWSNGTIFFDHSGCCAGTTQRLTVGITGSINEVESLRVPKGR